MIDLQLFRIEFYDYIEKMPSEHKDEIIRALRFAADNVESGRYNSIKSINSVWPERMNSLGVPANTMSIFIEAIREDDESS